MIAEIQLWGRTIGAVTWDANQDSAAFEYDRAFLQSGFEIAPLMMPLSDRVYSFPTLPRNTFLGLPGLLADALPDKFGNALINTWLASQGRKSAQFSSIERLCYTGRRGMGALEFLPAIGPRPRKTKRIEINALIDLASDVLTHRNTLQGSFKDSTREKALKDILRVGTSAGGARAKAVIAWNRQTNEVRSGQVAADTGFEYWLLKFDGVNGNKDKEMEDPKGYGAIEYAYYLMAQAAGIQMSECRLLEEHDRRHFMTRRFDRLPGGEKLHMQSLCALAHYDFNAAGAYAYEQAFLVMSQLHLDMDATEQQFRRMAFNIVARNQDDHVKNIAFLMDKTGRWSLSPAFDITYSYNPDGAWTATHQMTINSKRDSFTMADFNACAKSAQMKRGRAQEILKEVIAAVKHWPKYAEAGKVKAAWIQQIQAQHRLKFSKD
ncbi:MAG: serine/threonine-protein kinase HipA [Lentimonas sp.]|jgi:serine/threonine-protein kinase HipA